MGDVRMKAVFSTRILAVVLMLLVGIGVGCSKDEKKTTIDEQPTISYNISGKVVDAAGTGVSGVEVTCLLNGVIGQTTTSATGEYTIYDVQQGKYTINVTKSGYTFGSTFADVTDNGTSVSDIRIKSLATATTRTEQIANTSDIKTSGVTIQTEKNTNVSTGGSGTEQKAQVVSAAIAADTDITVDGQVVTGAISLSATVSEVNEIPPAAENELSLGSVIFEPQNAVFSKPVEIKLPVDIQLPSGLQVPLKKYENGAWQDAGVATIDESGLGASASVTEFKQFSVQPQVSLATQPETPNEQEQAQTDVASGQKKIPVEFENNIEFSDGLPAGISQEYALALIKKMKGIEIGKSSVTLEVPEINQAASKPASPMSANSTEVWVQKNILVEKLVEQYETITITIDIAGNQYTYTFRFKVIKRIYELKSTLVWQQHNQGSVN